MHTNLFNESFSFCSRDDLERLQPVSQLLLGITVGGSNVLPLRPIDAVYVDTEAPGKIRIYVEEDAEQPDYVASTHEGDFAKTVLRLQNTCVKKFFTGIRDSLFMSYWKAQEAAACTVVSIDFYLLGATDYGVLDSIVNHLRPRTTGFSITVNSSRPEYLGLLARDSFLNNLQTCRLDVSENAFPTPAFFLKEPGYPNYKVKCWRRCGQLADGIDAFIESFVRDGCPNKKLESVCIQWIDDEGPPSTAPKQLSKPTKSDMNLPENCLSGFITRMDHQVVQCEMYSFVNEKQWKRMESTSGALDTMTVTVAVRPTFFSVAWKTSELT